MSWKNTKIINNKSQEKNIIIKERVNAKAQVRAVWPDEASGMPRPSPAFVAFSFGLDRSQSLRQLVNQSITQFYLFAFGVAFAGGVNCLAY